MALCKHCQEPIGLIHRCKPPVVSKVCARSGEALARSTLMMHDAGYDVDLVQVALARALLDLQAKLDEQKDLARWEEDHG